MPRQERARLNHTPLVSPVDMAKRFANQIHPRENPQDKPNVYLRQGAIVSVQTATVTITLGGDTIPIVGVPVVGGYKPSAGEGVQVLETSAGDLVVLSRSNPSVATWSDPKRLNDVVISAGLTVGQAMATAITLNFTTIQANAILHCGFMVDGNTTVANAGNFANIYYRLDGGVDVFTRLSFSMTNVLRIWQWRGLALTIPTPGAHTLDMRHNKNGLGGTFVNDANSLIGDIILFE